MSEKETLASFIGEPEPHLAPLVISMPENYEDDLRPMKPLPAFQDPINPTMAEEIGTFFIDTLNRRTSDFQGSWLVWKGTKKNLRRGKMLFELQQRSSDDYVRGCRTVSFTIRVSKPPLLRRMAAAFLAAIRRVRHVLGPREQGQQGEMGSRVDVASALPGGR